MALSTFIAFFQKLHTIFVYENEQDVHRDFRQLKLISNSAVDHSDITQIISYYCHICYLSVATVW